MRRFDWIASLCGVLRSTSMPGEDLVPDLREHAELDELLDTRRPRTL